MIAGGNKNYKELNVCGSFLASIRSSDRDTGGNGMSGNGVPGSGSFLDFADMGWKLRLLDTPIKKQKPKPTPRDILQTSFTAPFFQIFSCLKITN